MTAPPCIVIPPAAEASRLPSTAEDLLPKLVAMLFQVRGDAESTIGEVIAALVNEGRRFRETDSGRRWVSVLENSKLVTNGWIVWNMLDLDRHLTRRDELAGSDTPAMLVGDVLRQLHSARIEELIELANGLWADEASRNEADHA